MNVLERAKILADDCTIRCRDLPDEVLRPDEAVERSSKRAIVSHEQSDDLTAIQRQKVIEVLERESSNKARAARALGISRRKLYRLLEKYGLSVANDAQGEVDKIGAGEM
jgi:transcriptional regulator of acetoin/glycerol metabolism